MQSPPPKEGGNHNAEMPQLMRVEPHVKATGKPFLWHSLMKYQKAQAIKSHHARAAIPRHLELFGWTRAQPVDQRHQPKANHRHHAHLARRPSNHAMQSKANNRKIDCFF